MTDSEKAQIRLACVIEASKLKQNPTTAQALGGKSIVDIAQELEAFILKG